MLLSYLHIVILDHVSFIGTYICAQIDIMKSNGSFINRSFQFTFKVALILRLNYIIHVEIILFVINIYSSSVCRGFISYRANIRVQCTRSARRKGVNNCNIQKIFRDVRRTNQRLEKKVH